jgi:hypothetical protein
VNSVPYTFSQCKESPTWFFTLIVPFLIRHCLFRQWQYLSIQHFKRLLFMNRFVLSLCRGLLCLVVPVFTFAQTQTKETALIPSFLSTDVLLSGSQQAPTLPSNVSGSWYEQAVNSLREREYFMKPMKQPFTYGAVNRAQHTGFCFTPEGYQVKQFNWQDFTADWEVDFQLKGVGREHTMQLKFPVATTTTRNDNQLTYHYNGFSVQYINDNRGLRQNFIIQHKPQGQGMLSVQVQLQSALQASLIGNSKLILHEPNNISSVKMIYDGLRAWDVNNQDVAAHFELSEDGTLSILADDNNAVYPITIDPLNHLPNWTSNGNGLLFPLLNDLATPVLFGTSVSAAGDVNNDPYDDIVVGAPAYVDIISVGGNTFNVATVGAAFVYLGSSTGTATTPSEVLQPTSQLGALFGYSVSNAGDVNHDGFDDIVVGAPGDHVSLTVALSTVSVAVGKVYIYYGGPAFDGVVSSEPAVSVSLSLTQTDLGGILAVVPANPLYGFSVSTAGNVDGDLFADVVVGSPAYTRLLPLPITLGGRVDIYHGSGTGIATTPTHSIVGNLLGGLFGFSVSTAGNVNNDAYSDIIAGAPASIGLIPVSVGSAYVFNGSATGITATTVSGANATLTGAVGLLTQALFGFSVSEAGDVNGDGFGDVIIGEPLATELVLGQLISVGKAHIYYGSASGITTTGATQLTSPRSPGILGLIQGNLLYGFSVSTAGDVNCDGRADVIIGEPGGTGISLGSGLLGLVSANALSGKAYIYYGRATTGPLNSPSWIFQETGSVSAANLIGTSVSNAGDVNGDGKADFLIGAPNGSLNLAGSLTGIVGSVIDTVLTNSIGNAYGFSGCLSEVDLDFDNDGVPDAIDLDDDNDGTPDLNEYPGIVLTQDPAADADGDGIPNYMDADFTGCGGINGSGICANFDKDGDGVPNSFDLDADNDGVPDVIEAGGIDTNGDGVLDNFNDTDADGLSQSIDANNTGAAGSGTGLGVVDFDGDGLINSLDLDSDADGITDLREAGLPDADNNAMIDAFADTDVDGYANAIDPKNGHSGIGDPAGPGTPALTTPTDTNNDGRYNGNPTTGNTDTDARYNFLDADSDNDGITDNVEAQATAAYVLPTAADTDNDGLANVYEGGTGGGLVPNNHDGTDNPDYLDADSDNDGVTDVIEGHDYNLNGKKDDDVTLTITDTDGDGIDEKFDLVAGLNVTTQGMGSPPTPGARGPLQTTLGGSLDRDFRNSAYLLPVTLTKFTGRQSGGSVILDWATATEQQTAYFEVERSADGNGYSAIGKVSAKGNSNTLTNYTFTDQQPNPSVNYYRLKIVDVDGRSARSKVVLLRSDRPGQNITISPNPVKDQLQVVWNNMPAGDYKIELLNGNGQLVKSFRSVVSSANQVMSIPREAGWKNGVYLVRVTSGKDKHLIKIVLE